MAVRQMFNENVTILMGLSVLFCQRKTAEEILLFPFILAFIDGIQLIKK